MKKKLAYIATIGIILLTSCSDNWMNLYPSDATTTDKAISSAKDAEYAINGIYSAMQSYEYYGARMVYYGDVTGDDAQANGNTKRCAYYYLFKYNKDDAPTSLWKSPYLVMRLTNNLLAANPVYLSDDLRGQALAIRALALFDVTRIYGYPYTKDNGASLGGIIMTSAPKYNSKPTRNTVAECYERIIKDLSDAIKLLNNEVRPGKINRVAAKALLARVYLYKGENTLALSTAEEAIKEAKLLNYDIWSNSEYVNGFKTGLDKEVLFKIINTSTDNAGNESLGSLYNKKGYDDIVITTDFTTLINEDPNDIRKKLYSGSYSNKYLGNDNTEDYRSSDIIIIRMSELYLIAAEAAVKTSNNSKAASYFNVIATRANPAAVIKDAVTLEQVLTERRKELMGEGHRFFDAMRNNITISRKGASHLPALTPDATTFNWDYYKIILPIPKYEMDANENIRNQQNPGY